MGLPLWYGLYKEHTLQAIKALIGSKACLWNGANTRSFMWLYTIIWFLVKKTRGFFRTVTVIHSKIQLVTVHYSKGVCYNVRWETWIEAQPLRSSISVLRFRYYTDRTQNVGHCYSDACVPPRKRFDNMGETRIRTHELFPKTRFLVKTRG